MFTTKIWLAGRDLFWRIKMDIAIIIPKTEKGWLEDVDNYMKDQDMELLFRVSQFPKYANSGDKCYCVQNGYILGYHLIKTFEDIKASWTCAIQGARWQKEPGKYIVRNASTWHKFKEPVKYNSKPHRGFAYFKGAIVPKEFIEFD